jgi:cysteine desulfurase
MAPMTGIYLDYNATTPCDPRVVEAMLPYFTEWYGNPANGLHPQGRKAERAVGEARTQVADLLCADPSEIVFTAGATESNNLAILGSASARRNPSRNRIVTCAVEHKAVLLPSKRLEEYGFELCILPVDTDGKVDLNAAASVIDETTFLVSIQAANNEVGTIQPIPEIASLAQRTGAYFHCDAAQAVGKIPVDVHAWSVDFLSLSAHKFYGPKGIGALYVRSGRGMQVLSPLVLGGGHERGLRSGTLNVPAIVGFGEAARLLCGLLDTEMARIEELRRRFEAAIQAKIPTARINAQGATRLPNTSSITLPGIDVDALLLSLPDVMMGTGSACTAGAVEPSHVLTAMALSWEDAYSTIRASLGRYTSAEEIDIAAERIEAEYAKLTLHSST